MFPHKYNITIVNMSLFYRMSCFIKNRIFIRSNLFQKDYLTATNLRKNCTERNPLVLAGWNFLVLRSFLIRLVSSIVCERTSVSPQQCFNITVVPRPQNERCSTQCKSGCADLFGLVFDGAQHRFEVA